MPIQQRKPSDNLYTKLREWEGVRLKSYKDSAGIWTIGVGSTLYTSGKRVGPNETITSEQADQLLRWEVERKAAIVDKLIGPTTKVTQNQFDALVSFAFNCGIGALEQSTLLKRVRLNPNDPLIADAFLMWVKITQAGKKVVSPGLVNRRKKEIVLYFKN